MIARRLMSHQTLHKSLIINPTLRTSILLPRFYSTKSPFPLKPPTPTSKEPEMPKWRQWGLYMKTKEFKKKMTGYYLGGFGVVLITMFFYMRDRFHENKQLKIIQSKYFKDPKSLSEYEYLMFKTHNPQEKLRPLEMKKYKIYQMMRKEFRRKNLLDSEAIFNPTPEELDEWYGSQASRVKKLRAPVLTEDIMGKGRDLNKSNPNIVSAEDTTAFFDAKAKEYDDEIKWEERGILMGFRRSWLMRQLKGDVLEVACGTGRNIPYLRTDKIKSITFLDSSRNMVELCKEKFRAAHPKFQKVAFTVGKAEDLVDLADDNLKYDTVVEAFGLCAHEDPVLALKNMAKLLKPGGRIVLLEHGRSTWDFINNHLDFRSEKRMKTWACRWNLDIGELVDEAGLDITYEKRVHFRTTWMLVCKKPEDPLSFDEKPFWNKLWGTEVQHVKR